MAYNNNKIKIIATTAVLASLALTSLNANADPLTNAILACKTEQNALKRLVCFDEIANSLSQGDELPVAEIRTPPVAPTAPTTTPTPPKPANKDDFGLEKKTPDELSGIIAEVSVDNRKRQSFSLENGQVWREVQPTSTRVRVGDDITIEKGFFGAFYLSVVGSNRTIQVKRIK